MNNLDKFLKQCIKENSQKYLIEEFDKLMKYDCYISLTKDILLRMYAAGEIDYLEYQRELKKLTLYHFDN